MFSYVEVPLAGGDEGVRQTVRAMIRLAREGAVHPMVRERAAAIIAGLPVTATVDQAEAIRRWCASAIQFLRDPRDVELLHEPEAMLRKLAMSGTIRVDCDDAAILAASLGLAIGLRARYVTVAFLDARAPFQHIWAELSPPTGTGDEWIECDVTRSFQNVPTHLIARVLVASVV